MALRLPGDYTLKTLNIKNDKSTVDVKDLMLGLEIFEDIYVSGMTGKLHLLDALDLYENLPIVGGEEIEVSFSTDLDGNQLPKEFEFKKTFIVTGIVNIEEAQNDHTKSYTLELASKIYFRNHEVKISKAYNANIKDTVESVFATLGLDDDIIVEPTKYAESIVVPNWSPIRTIDYLSKHAQSADCLDSAFLFFENKDNFVFASLSYLFGKGSTRTLTKKNIWTDNKIVENDPHVIMDISVDHTPDLLDNISTGLYGGTLHTLDLRQKKYTKTTFDYEDSFNDCVHLNGKLLPQPSSASSSDYIHTLQSENFLGANSRTTRLERTSRLNQINAFVITIKCPNYTTQKVGDVITLDIQSAKEMTEIQGSETPDKTLSGNYLIRAIRHIVAQGGYDMVMELVKEST